MKRKKLLPSLLVLLVFSAMVLSGCQKKTAESKLDCPFTKMGWDNTKDEVIAEEGKNYETYDSVYNGTTYTYEKDYEDKTGTIKYMFDDKEKLMCVAWTYTSDSDDKIKQLYNTINDSVTKKYGESHYSPDTTKNVNNSGNIWYLDTGDIVISTVTTDANKALQYAYLNPKVSNEEAQEK